MDEHEPRPQGVFYEMVQEQFARGAYVCVGLDPSESRDEIKKTVAHPADFEHNPHWAAINYYRWAVDATCDVAGSYKLDEALLENLVGQAGIVQIARHIQRHPHIPIVFDSKSCGTVREMLERAAFAFEVVKADAMTVAPYMGYEPIAAVTERWPHKGIFVVDRTSNEGAHHPQKAVVSRKEGWEYLYRTVAKEVVENWPHNPNVGVVAAANHPEDLGQIRRLVGDKLILSPGVGAQGGSVEMALRYGAASALPNILIIGASDLMDPKVNQTGFDQLELVRAATLQLHNSIKQALAA